MFDLEQAIADWRREMLAAGIKTPVPLDELEIHLREEFEHQIKLRLNEAEALEAAVEKIGRAHLLQKEFKKVKRDRTLVRTILLAIGWLGASCLLACSVLIWNIQWNLFSFGPEWNQSLIWETLGILAAITAIWFLAKASRNKANLVVSLLLCVLLAGFAVFLLYADEHAPGLLGSSHGEVPLWYRGGRTLPLCVPFIFWIWWSRRQLTQKRNPTPENRPIRSA